jgi:hypothetical protein
VNPPVITTALLVDLVRRFVLHDDEPIVWSRQYPEAPAVALETTGRFFFVSVVRDWLLVERAPWVAAVVVAQRQDQVVEGGGPRHTFLVQRDGSAVPLDDAGAVAALGMRLDRGDLDVTAYAELLVQCQWPGGWNARLVLDPAAWRGAYPAEAKLPQVEAVHTWREAGTLWVRFFASREHTVVVGGRSVLDVADWSLRAPAGEPATWVIRPVAEAVPLLPPW